MSFRNNKLNKMKNIINSKGVETKIFAETFEYDAFEQIKKLANFEPYLDSKIRIMPDAHAGKGCTVGTTMTIKDCVTPNIVGVDIGCGMLTIKLKNNEIDLEKLDSVIRNKVPSGFSVHEKAKYKFDFEKLKCKDNVDLGRALLSIGSLGGGNHFIELAESVSTGYLYLIIHSGSRKLGGDVCKYYQDLAFQNANEMKKVKENLVLKLKKAGREKDIEKELKKIQKPVVDKDLAFLKGKDFDNYMNDMKIAQEFALLNRDTMGNIIIKEMGIQEVERFHTIHNYIDFDSMILRKGAIRAKENEMVLIPMNMRDGSLLCVGKGNEDWNYSAPHGAGRLYSRSKAKQLISLEEFEDSMKNVYTTSVSTSTIDEAPQVYKPMQEIIDCIGDTVEVIDILKPLYNFKAS